MTVQLRTHAAIERADAERGRAGEKAAAYRQFADRVEGVLGNGEAANGTTANDGSTDGPVAASAMRQSQTGGALAVSGASRAASPDTEAVREAFAATVLPHADAETTERALADELSTDLAAALSPAAGGLSSGLGARLLERVSERHRECQLLSKAIEDERERLEAVAAELDAVTSWVADADETPLLQLGFEELRERHERLERHRETCDGLARERQAARRGTRNDGLTGIRRCELLALLYEGFADDNPVLADLARLDDVLAECQRSVRRHLCARV